MGGVQAEAVGLLDLVLEGTQHLGWDNHHAATGFAHQVVVHVVGQVVHSWPVTEMYMGHHAEVSQRVEAAVDRRIVDVRMMSSDRGRKLLGGDVLTGVEERPDDGSPGRGHPATACPELTQDAFEPGLGHGAVTYRRPRRGRGGKRLVAPAGVITGE